MKFTMIRSILLVAAFLTMPSVAFAQKNDDELIKEALTYAREGGFDLAVYKRNISSGPNFFKAFARSAQRADGQEKLYLAQDTLTKNFEEIRADLRSKAVNNVMVYLQMGIIGGLLKKYGFPGKSGQQEADLVFESAGVNPAGEMSNVDACALSTAFSNYYNSFMHSSLEDRHVFAINEYLDKQCQDAGFPSCAEVDLDRRQCDGYNVNSKVAEEMVRIVNIAW
jgi:hypothetical protein